MESARDRGEAFVDLVKDAIDIASSGATWETKYELIFSDEISKAIGDLGFELEWYDPDTSYEEDVKAYLRSVSEKAKDICKAFGWGF